VPAGLITRRSVVQIHLPLKSFFFAKKKYFRRYGAIFNPSSHNKLMHEKKLLDDEDSLIAMKLYELEVKRKAGTLRTETLGEVKKKYHHS
jgi:hypothetical protein